MNRLYSPVTIGIELNLSGFKDLASMSLLPRTAEEFSSADYWERFFRKRGEKAFEWYGDYNSLCGILHKYIKPRDKVSVYLF